MFRESEDILDEKLYKCQLVTRDSEFHVYRGGSVLWWKMTALFTAVPMTKLG